MNNKKVSRIKLLPYLAIFLLVLAFVGVRFLPRLYAKYTSSGTTANEAQVAKFDVTAGDSYSDTCEISVNPQSEVSQYLYEVSNSGEVVLRVEVKLEIRGNLPLQISVKSPKNAESALREIENTLSPSVEADPIIVTWDYILSPNSVNIDLIEIGWTSEAGFDDARYANGVEGIKMTISAYQID
jgi:hypothetical protein